MYETCGCYIVVTENQSARFKRAMLLHEIGLVNRDGKVFTVKSPTRGKEQDMAR